jgi:hypothetical protein
MFRKIQPFLQNTLLKGQVISLKNFLSANEHRNITPYDGTISEVIVDGYVTDILIANWDMYQVDDTAEIMSLRELEKIVPNAEILWIWKK